MAFPPLSDELEGAEDRQPTVSVNPTSRAIENSSVRGIFPGLGITATFQTPKSVCAKYSAKANPIIDAWQRTSVRQRGERIRKLRRAKGWRQIDLAEHSGVHEVHISDLERGTREPGLRTLSKIASALGTTLSELLKGL